MVDCTFLESILLYLTLRERRASGYVPSSFSLRDFSFTVASFRASLSLSAQYFALSDKGAREIIVSAYRSIPIKYLPCGSRKRWRYVASVEDPRRVSVYLDAKENGIGKEGDECRKGGRGVVELKLRILFRSLGSRRREDRDSTPGSIGTG